MVQLLDFFGLISVLFRAATLCFQSLTIGGIVFSIAVTRTPRLRTEFVSRVCARWIFGSAIALAVTQFLYAAANGLILMKSAKLSLDEVAGANFVLAGALAVVSALAIAIVCSIREGQGITFLLVPAALILAASVMTSHSVARMEHRAPLILLTALHQAATATWIGGLPYLLLSLRSEPDPALKQQLRANFSQLALISVIALFAAGFGLSLFYIGSWPALYGTSYGVMVGAKAALFACLLVLGALNFWIVRRIPAVSGSRRASLLRFGEAEIGIGIAVILAAASLTSQPPAADLVEGRVTRAEITARLSPHRPRLTSPDIRDLSGSALPILSRPSAAGTTLPSSSASGRIIFDPRAPVEMAWSEYNHNWAGIIVLTIGLLAFAACTGRVSWARHWPLAFLALAGFLFFRSDPENWPLGPNGFWESFADPEVVQHRVVVLLVIALAVFEWAVVNNRLRSRAAALVFPSVCALGGMILLTHSHALGNVKAELLTELSHAPLGILGIVAGWSRCLELRLPPEERARRIFSWVWPVCFILIGCILLNYRES